MLDDVGGDHFCPRRDISILEGKQRLCELCNFGDHAVCIVEEAFLAAFESAFQTAETGIVDLETVGLVDRIPLTAETPATNAAI